jgi:hypothetical protein
VCVGDGVGAVDVGAPVGVEVTNVGNSVGGVGGSVGAAVPLVALGVGTAVGGYVGEAVLVVANRCSKPRSFKKVASLI